MRNKKNTTHFAHLFLLHLPLLLSTVSDFEARPMAGNSRQRPTGRGRGAGRGGASRPPAPHPPPTPTPPRRPPNPQLVDDAAGHLANIDDSPATRTRRQCLLALHSGVNTDSDALPRTSANTDSDADIVDDDPEDTPATRRRRQRHEQLAMATTRARTATNIFCADCLLLLTQVMTMTVMRTTTLWMTNLRLLLLFQCLSVDRCNTAPTDSQMWEGIGCWRNV
jgi:hypothetical protein